MDIDVIDELQRLFDGEGARDYLGEPVTQAEHMLQAAALAVRDGAPDALVAAALLHDVGHFHGVVTGADLMAGTDNHHSDTGADWLAQWFGPAVCEPVRLHVAAKRYLCAVEPGYYERLSEASRFTLGVQGGPMPAEQAARFAALEFAADAVTLRRWDERAKDPSMNVPPFSWYHQILRNLAMRRLSD
ncbi:phosphonate degradation HD-domain oxygenase [Dactylosporangium sp. CA-092794]|uniref:phosphonate degradation HD-domain oxygenase n=1 Tax=Dactylosporangium sp. CA-092794 TaxID=3239929 RepID=UPI003D8CCE9E